MDDARAQLADKLQSSNNILVTVSRDPSLDQLSALLGLTLLLNKQGKHAAAVFSGQIPSVMEFLNPDSTIEKNTDSLRDFIIALDKDKADKLRYKVEDDVVRIFITPYKTSISEADFDFSQGDFNVDVVVALGVQRQEDLDEAITAHGRILHDATVASITISAEGGLGSINWQVPEASSLSELVTELSNTLGDGLLDEQIATALLTGIVAETDRFRNEKTSSQTMTLSAVLMSAGANQQLIADKLEEPQVLPVEEPEEPVEAEEAADVPEEEEEVETSANDGTIEIDHDAPDESDEAAEPETEFEPEQAPEEAAPEEPPFELPSPVETEQRPEPEPAAEPIAEPEPAPIDVVAPVADSFSSFSGGSKLITEPPTLGGTLTANSSQQTLDPTTDPFSMSAQDQPQLLTHDDTMTAPPVIPVLQPPAGPPADAPGDFTLMNLEQTIDPTASAATPPTEPHGIDAVRDEVNRALNSSDSPDIAPPPPIEALNAQPVFDGLHAAPFTPPPAAPPTIDSNASPVPTIDSNAPPPVPPPIPFQFGAPPQQ